jgi:hypothetical protein
MTFALASLAALALPLALHAAPAEHGRTQLNLAARQKLMQDQLSLTLRVIDPFDTSHERGTTIDPRFFQTSDRARAIRGLLLSASWTFGKPEKERDTIDLSGDGAP